MLVRELFNRCNGVGRRRTAKLDIVGFEARVPSDRCLQHLPAGLTGGDWCIFPRRSCGRDKDNLFEPELLEGFTRQNQVGAMDRIERASVNSDLLQGRSDSSVKKILASLAFEADDITGPTSDDRGGSIAACKFRLDRGAAVTFKKHVPFPAITARDQICPLFTIPLRDGININ